MTKSNYTRTEMCKLLRISRYTLTKMINDGDIKTIKVGDMLRITHQEYIRFLGGSDER